jgi:hypothetical protein
MNILDEYEKQLGGISGSFRDIPIRQNVEDELSFWDGKKETDAQSYSQLEKYWKNIDYGEWSPSGTPWSAAFISYVLRGSDFPQTAAHRIYVKDIIDGKKPTWAAFSIPKSQEIPLHVGDVLVKPRSGDYNNTHGDVVYKIVDGMAYLVGGNISNTAKITRIIKVDKDNVAVEDVSPYMIILKKKGSSLNVPILAAGAGVFALLMFRSLRR